MGVWVEGHRGGIQQAAADLSLSIPCFALFETSLAHYMFKHVSAWHILHCNCQIPGCQKHLQGVARTINSVSIESLSGAALHRLCSPL